MTKLKNLLDCHGRPFRCKIDGTQCEGRITVEDEKVYLCQNKCDGFDCEDKQGFLYSWKITAFQKDILDNKSNVDVTEFVLLDSNNEHFRLANIQDLVPGNIIQYRHFEPREILKVSNGIVEYARVSTGKEYEFTIEEFKEKPWAYIFISSNSNSSYSEQVSSPSITDAPILNTTSYDEDFILDFVKRNTIGGTDLFPILNR